jgi:hypothetical protein
MRAILFILINLSLLLSIYLLFMDQIDQWLVNKLTDL